MEFTSLPILAWLALGLFVAAFSRGYSGFGFSALLVGSWSLVVPPSRAVAAALLFEIVASCLQARDVWRDVPWRRVGMLVAGALVGNVVGVQLLAWLPADTLRVVIAGVMIVAGGLMLSGWKRRAPTGRAGEAAVGVASGLVNGTTAMGGMPIALLFVADAMSPVTIRAAFVAFFFATDLFAVVLVAGQGLIDRALILTVAAGLPLLALGIWLGDKHFLGATPEGFRRFNLTLLIVLALAVLGRAAFGA